MQIGMNHFFKIYLEKYTFNLLNLLIYFIVNKIYNNHVNILNKTKYNHTEYNTNIGEYMISTLLFFIAQ